MHLNWSCFLSHRHVESELAARAVQDIYEALTNELTALINQPVFIDAERLKGGMFFNEAIAQALCRSACMVVVYTPVYFDPQHIYCAREYRAMEALEAQRIGALGYAGARENGLIIPIVIRGAERLPKEIADHRQYYNFDTFLLSDRRMTRNPRYAPRIREIAEYIAARWRELQAVTDGIDECENFSLPSEDETREWLLTLPLYHGVMPFREPGQ